MFAFCFFEAFYINCKAIFSSKFLCKFQRISVCFIQVVSYFTRNNFLWIFHKIWKHFLEFCFTLLKSLAEFCFFCCKFLVNFCRVLFQFWICIFEVFNNNCCNFCHKVFVDSKLHSVANCTTNQAAENITSTYTVWSNTFLVTKNEYRRARVVGNNTN